MKGWAADFSRVAHYVVAVGDCAPYARFDAERRFAVPSVRIADPKSCQRGEVLKGVLKPRQCKVFGTACTPEIPTVSSEGACAAYHRYAGARGEAA